MLTRREILKGTVAAMLVGARALGKASQPSTEIKFELPAGACDCHTHIFGDPKEFPLSPLRIYTPETAGPEEMAALHRALHVQRVVIVTPSVYGTDNAATLYGIKARGKDARGVAVIGEGTGKSELDAMDRAGIKGIRLNFGTGGTDDHGVGRARFQAALGWIKGRDWHLQVATNLTMIAALEDLIMASPVPVVLDHFGGARAELGVGQPGFSNLVNLVRSGKAYVKISAAYRVSQRPPDYSDIVPLAQALITANPDRILWGTDWPHPDSSAPPGRKSTDISPLYPIDDAGILNQLPVWAPDAAVRKKILVSNPAKLYAL
jgi:predicted TIM-barrel fold metal-dependent hydrolase